MIAGLLIVPVLPALLIALPHRLARDSIAAKQLKFAALIGVVAYSVSLLSGLLVRDFGMVAAMIDLPIFVIGGMPALGTLWMIARPDRR